MSSHTGLVTSHGFLAHPPGVGSGNTCSSSREILFTENHEGYSFTSDVSSATASAVPAMHKMFDELSSLPHPSPILAATLNGCNGQPVDPFTILDLPISKHSFASTTSCRSLYSDTLHSLDNQHDLDDSVDGSSSSALDLADYPSTLTNNTISAFSSFYRGQLISSRSSPSAAHQFTVRDLATKDNTSFQLGSPSALPVDDNDEETDIVPSELIQFVSESTRRIQGELADAVSVDGSDLEALDHEARLASLCLPILQPPSIVSSHISDSLRPPSLSPEPIADNYSDSDFAKVYFSESMVIDPMFRSSEGTSLDISASLHGISPDQSISTSPLAFSVSDDSSPRVPHLSTASSDLFAHASVGSLGIPPLALCSRTDTQVPDFPIHAQKSHHHNGTMLQPALDTIDSPLPFRSLSTQDPIDSHPSNLESRVVQRVNVSDVAPSNPFISAFRSQVLSTADGVAPPMDFSLLTSTPHSCASSLIFKVDEQGVSCRSTPLKYEDKTQFPLTTSTHSSLCNGFAFPNDPNSPDDEKPSINHTSSADDFYGGVASFHSELSSINGFPVSSMLLTGSTQSAVTDVYTAPSVAPFKDVTSPFFVIGKDSVCMTSSSSDLHFVSPNHVNFGDSSKSNIPSFPGQPATDILSNHFFLAPSTNSPHPVSPQTSLTFQLLSSLPALRPGMSILLNLASGTTNGFVNTSSPSIVLNTSAPLPVAKSNSAVILLPNLAGTAISGVTGTTAPVSYQPNSGFPHTSPTNPLVIIPSVSSSNAVTFPASLTSADVRNEVDSTLGAHLSLPLTTHVFLLRSSKPQFKSDPSTQHTLPHPVTNSLSRIPLIVTPSTSQASTADTGRLLFIPSLVPVSTPNTPFPLNYENIEQSVCNSGSALNGVPLVATSYNTGIAYETSAATSLHEFDSFNSGLNGVQPSSLCNSTASPHASITIPNNQIFSFPLTLFPNTNSHTIFSSSWSATSSQPKCVTAQSFLSPISTIPSALSTSNLPLQQPAFRPPSPVTCSADTGDLSAPLNSPLVLVSLFPPTFSSASGVNTLTNTSANVHGVDGAALKSSVSPGPDCGRGIVLPSADNLLSSRPMVTPSLSSSSPVLIQPSKTLDSKCPSASCGSSSRSNGDTSPPFLCNTSPLVSSSSRRRHQCPYCPKSCERKDNLQAHIRTHTGERPYPCRFCPKAFPQKDHLRAHIRTHTGEKPYRCPQCMKAFAQLGNLHRHVKTHRR